MFRYWSNFSNGPFWDKVALVAAAFFVVAFFAFFSYWRKKHHPRDCNPSGEVKGH